MAHNVEPPFTALLIGGPSGVGKSTAAAALARQLGMPWLQVDDLRLALQFGGLVPRERHPELFFFLDRGERPVTPEAYRDGLIAVGRVIAGALDIVVESHIATGVPIIIEGDGILPDIAARIVGTFGECQVRAVFIVEHDADVLRANMLSRGRGIDPNAAHQRQADMRGVALFSDWIEREARRHNLPMLAPTPWQSLARRILSVTETQQTE